MRSRWVRPQERRRQIWLRNFNKRLPRAYQNKSHLQQWSKNEEKLMLAKSESQQSKNAAFHLPSRRFIPKEQLCSSSETEQWFHSDAKSLYRERIQPWRSAEASQPIQSILKSASSLWPQARRRQPRRSCSALSDPSEDSWRWLRQSRKRHRHTETLRWPDDETDAAIQLY